MIPDVDLETYKKALDILQSNNTDLVKITGVVVLALTLMVQQQIAALERPPPPPLSEQ